MNKIGDTTNTTPTPVRPPVAPKPTATPRQKMGGDSLSLGSTPTPTPGPAPTATPAATATPSTPGRPAGATTPNPATSGENILDDSAGRKAYDVVSGTAGAADGARAIKPAVTAIETAAGAGKLGRLGTLGTRLAQGGGKLLELGSAIAGKFKWITPLASGLAKAAPFLGVGVAALDIGKAAIEKDPAKKEKAQGMAVLSTVSGAAGILAWAGAAGAVVGGVALAPIAVPAMIIGGVATVAALADQFFLDGAISKGVAKGAKAVWGAITSL